MWGAVRSRGTCVSAGALLDGEAGVWCQETHDSAGASGHLAALETS
jgi:hypothetical protein